MKILVVSDTHGRVDAFIEELNKHRDADMIFHLGDLVQDAEIIAESTSVPMRIVRGNNDYFDKNTPLYDIVRIGGIKILLTHGHKENVYFGVSQLVRKAKECDVDMVLYGHTHIFHNEVVDGIRVINPGSAGYDRAGEFESFVILEISDEKIEIERVRL